MQLVLVAHRSSTSLKITDVGIIVGYNQRTLELSGITRINTEITAQFHRTAHAFGDIDKRTVTKHGTVQCCEEIVAVGHDGAEILAHQVAMLLDGIADGTEDDALLTEFFLKSGLHADRVHDGIHGSVAAQCQPLFQRNTQFVESLLQLRVNLSVPSWLLGHRVGIVADCLIVDGRHMHMSPSRFLLFLPVAERLQAELEHPLGFPFLSRDEPNDVLVQPLLNDFSMYIRGETELIFLFGYLTDVLVTCPACFTCGGSKFFILHSSLFSFTVSGRPLSR